MTADWIDEVRSRQPIQCGSQTLLEKSSLRIKQAQKQIHADALMKGYLALSRRLMVESGCLYISKPSATAIGAPGLFRQPRMACLPVTRAVPVKAILAGDRLPET
jgi:hypothetical protein